MYGVLQPLRGFTCGKCVSFWKLNGNVSIWWAWMRVLWSWAYSSIIMGNIASAMASGPSDIGLLLFKTTAINFGAISMWYLSWNGILMLKINFRIFFPTNNLVFGESFVFSYKISVLNLKNYYENCLSLCQSDSSLHLSYSSSISPSTCMLIDPGTGEFLSHTFPLQVTVQINNVLITTTSIFTYFTRSSNSA